MPAVEGGGRAWGGDLFVFVGPGVGHLTDLVLPGEGIFESFFARRGDIWPPTRTKKTETVQQILSGLVVSVVYWYFWSWVRMLLTIVTIFFLSNWRDLHFHEQIQLKAGNSSSLCKLHKGRKGLRPMGSNADRFPLPLFTHAPYALERYGNHGGQREQAKAEWISLFCLQILFVLACFWSIEPLKILWYQSKGK